MHRSIAYCIGFYELGFFTGLHMVLVAKMSFPPLGGPFSVGILLTFLRFIPILRSFAVFDLLVFFSTVALLWCLYEAGIHDISALSNDSIFHEKRAELLEKNFNFSFPCKDLAEIPDSLFVRYCVIDLQTEKPHKRKPV